MSLASLDWRQGTQTRVRSSGWELYTWLCENPLVELPISASQCSLCGFWSQFRAMRGATRRYIAPENSSNYSH
jgi:hypothetical protein